MLGVHRSRLWTGVQLACVLAAAAAAAAASEAGARPSVAGEAPKAWFAGDRVTLRLVAEAPDAEGRLRAALLVDLDPGWKTYWIDPGEAGIPPRVDLSGSRNLAVLAARFPAPHRFGDALTQSNGYSNPLAIAFDLKERSPGAPSEIHASVMLGVCKDICIPVAAELELAAPSAGATSADAAAVEAAFQALPAPADAAHAVTAALSADGARLTVTARAEASDHGKAADLFVAGPVGWNFGRPEPTDRRTGGLVFSVPVLGKPRKASAGALRVDAVLTLGAKAYEARQLGVAPQS